jgi:hypothetical protein
MPYVQILCQCKERKAGEKRQDFYSYQCEAEVSKSCNLNKRFGTVSIFTTLEEGYILFQIITVAFKGTVV